MENGIAIAEIDKQILQAQEGRKDVNFDYQNSSWAMGPKYRAKLDEIDDRIRALKAKRATRLAA